MKYNYLDMKLERFLKKLSDEEIIKLIDNTTKEYYLNCLKKDVEKVELDNNFLTAISSLYDGYNDYINFSLIKAFNMVFEKVIDSNIELYDPKYNNKSIDEKPFSCNDEKVLELISDSFINENYLETVRIQRKYIKDLEEELYQLKNTKELIK